MKSRKSKKGQTMVEYIIIVALIAIALIAVFTIFGGAVGKKVAGATDALDSDLGQEAKTRAEQLTDDVQDTKNIRELGN